MKINVFGKKRTSKDGRTFYTYLSTLTKKDGTEVSVEVKFKEDAGNPKNVPCTITFDKKDANYSEKVETYLDENMEEKETTRRRLWVNKYTETPYIDESMDDFV